MYPPDRVYISFIYRSSRRFPLALATELMSRGNGAGENLRQTRESSLGTFRTERSYASLFSAMILFQLGACRSISSIVWNCGVFGKREGKETKFFFRNSSNWFENFFIAIRNRPSDEKRFQRVQKLIRDCRERYEGSASAYAKHMSSTSATHGRDRRDLKCCGRSGGLNDDKLSRRSR